MLCIRHAVDKPPESLLIAHPCAFLWKAFKECDPFAEFLKQRLLIFPCSADKPWGLILYGDEVTPGDGIGGKQLRKLQAVYYSFLEFGTLALSNEKLWFTLTTTRSIEVALMPGGMALLYGTILHELFIDGPCPDTGITVNRDGEAPIEFFSTSESSLWMEPRTRPPGIARETGVRSTAFSAATSSPRPRRWQTKMAHA